MTRSLRRHPLLVLAGAGLLIVGLLAGALGIRAWTLYQAGASARRDLDLALTTTRQAGMALTADQARAVADELTRADDSLARLQVALAEDPAVAILRLVPAADHQLEAAATLVRATRLLTSRHQEIGSLLAGFVAARDGAQGLQRVAAFARLAAATRPEVADLATAFAESDRLVSGLSPAGLVGQLAAARSSLADQLAAARDIVAGSSTIEAVVPAILGVGGERRYLVLALDDAELRPIGGLIGAFATPTLQDGLLGDFTFHDVYDIDKVGQTTYVEPPPGLAGHLLGTVPWQVADAGWWPDFAVSAAAARRLYQIETGEGDFQGTIAFTPELVDALLQVVGPVEIPDMGLTVHPGETYLLSLQQVEILHHGPTRKRFLAELASRVLERLMALPPERYPDVFAALDRAGKHRQLQILFDDPAVQSTVDQLGWYTPFSFPSTGDRLAVIEANVGPVSKLDVLLRLDHELDVRLRPDGGADERLVTTYVNGYGPDLPPALEGVRPAFRYGILGSYQRRYLVPGARLVAVTSDGDPPLTAPERVAPELDCLVIANYLQIRPGITHLETRYVAPHVVESAVGDPARAGTYHLSFWKEAGRDQDTLIVHVTVPAGTVPVAWTSGGTVSGRTVTFSTTTEFDRTFEVTYGPG